jgi:hypothetical protein
MFEERDPQEMSNSPTQRPGATAGPNPNLPRPSTAPPASIPPKAGKMASKRPIGPRIVDMTKQVFMPSRIQPPPDIAIEYMDSNGKAAPRLKHEVEREFLDDVAVPGINSIRIGYTTNGRHSPNSNHRRGQAADIDSINGKPVNTYNKDPEVKAWVDAIVSRFDNRRDHEVYAPGRQLYRDGRPVDNATLASQHQDHIHWTRRR